MQYDNVTRILKIKRFLPGKQVLIQGQLCTVDHVHIHNYQLMIHFKELEDSINSNHIDCEYDEVNLVRN